MASLKDLRNRISSVKNTQKITKAMQMVAAAKLRRAQESAESARPYAVRMDQVLANLSGAMRDRTDGAPLLIGTGKSDVHLLIIATADRGLCGGFNSSIARMARVRANALLAQGAQVKILCVGKKGADALKRQFGHLMLETIELKEIKALNFEVASRIARQVLALFGDGEFDVATLFFGAFESIISQIPTEQQLIPAILPEQEGASAAADLGGAAYDYEPDEKDILEDLLPRNLTVQIFKALLENAASEQGARMSAMDNATRNAGEMIDKLTITYNRSRQAMITRDLIEIISGAEAL